MDAEHESRGRRGERRAVGEDGNVATATQVDTETSKHVLKRFVCVFLIPPMRDDSKSTILAPEESTL